MGAWDTMMNGEEFMKILGEKANAFKRENKKKIDLIPSDVFILKASQTAAYWHMDQFRKYGSKLPYIIHPIRVAGLISIHPDSTREIVAAAYLHDTIEDTDYPILDLYKDFGEEVHDLVLSVTNPSKGSTASRAERKQMDRDHLKEASKQSKLIKLVDRIDNLWDLTQAPADFIRLYLHESKLLLDEALQDVDAGYENEYRRAMEYLERTADWKERYGRDSKRNR